MIERIPSESLDELAAHLRDSGDIAALDHEDGKPCPDCGCLPGERAEGSDGDGVWFQAWACLCGCHYPAWMED